MHPRCSSASYALSLCLACLAGCSGPEREGERDAARDVAAGVLKIKTTRSGDHVPWTGEYVTLLNGRLGVQWEVVGDDAPSEELKKYVHAYNRRMSQAIAERFGDDAIAKISDEAKERHLKTLGSGGWR